VSKRPYTNLYYANPTDPPTQWVSHGHASSERGAIRASVVRVFVGQYAMTRVYCDGALLYTIHHNARGMRISYGVSKRELGRPHVQTAH
jgi:hypothetical protein